MGGHILEICGPDARFLHLAAPSETSSNCWKIRIINEMLTDREISAVSEHPESATNAVSFLVLIPQIYSELFSSLSCSSRTCCESRSFSSFRSWGGAVGKNHASTCDWPN